MDQKKGLDELFLLIMVSKLVCVKNNPYNFFKVKTWYIFVGFLAAELCGRDALNKVCRALNILKTYLEDLGLFFTFMRATAPY